MIGAQRFFRVVVPDGARHAVPGAVPLVAGDTVTVRVEGAGESTRPVVAS